MDVDSMTETKKEQDRSALVFVHGFLGFGEVCLPGFKVNYFRGVRDTLRSYGFSLYAPALPPTSIEDRAKRLGRSLTKLPHDRIYLVAHSMGGLDSRYFIHNLDHSQRVRCLVTVGAPHLGTPIAEWMLGKRGSLQWLGKHFLGNALRDLTPKACQRFNEMVPNRKDVRYISYAGARPAREMPLWLRPWTRMIAAAEGENDSLVAAASAKWGDFRGVIRADHAELVGWSIGFANPGYGRPFDHLAFYRQVMKEIMDT